MISTTQQMQDLTTFKNIKSSLEQLENRFETARNDINARERGCL